MKQLWSFDAFYELIQKPVIKTLKVFVAYRPKSNKKLSSETIF